jgi:hypothetical protein
MKLPNLFFAKKTTRKTTIISMAFLTLLLASGVLANVGVSTAAPSTTVEQTSTTIPAAAPTYVGTVGANPTGPFLTGPTLVTPAFGPAPPTSSSTATSSSLATSASPAKITGTYESPPTFNNKPAKTTAGTSPAGVDPPFQQCQTTSTCESVSQNDGGAQTNPVALNAAQNVQAFGYTIEPPDQGLCANNQYTMEILNIGNLQVYSTSSLNPVTNGYVTLDNLMGLANHLSSTYGVMGWSSAGDIMCNYDAANGGHWYITEIVSATPEAPQTSAGQPGPFQGCFVGVADTCMEGLAVSTTSNPMGSYNVYFFNPEVVNNDPGSDKTPDRFGLTGVLLNDFAKQGTTRDAFLLFYDEFDLYGGGLAGAAGAAQELAFSKSALDSGASASSIEVAYENMGTASNLYPIPSNGNFQPENGTCTTSSTTTLNEVCWFEVIPAQTPDSASYDNANGGTGWMVGALDFIGAGDNRVAAFDWTGLCALDSSITSSTSCKDSIMFGGTLYTTPEVVYMDEGYGCLIQYGGFCGLAQQQAGQIPLGDLCGPAGYSSIAASCPENGIATNGDSGTQASYADGQLWTAISTAVIESFGSSSEVHVGAAYWAIGSTSVTSAGIISAVHEDIIMPAIAATDDGAALMSFTLSGPDYFPSSAFTWLTPTQYGRGDESSGVIHITALGKAPQDGFTEYQVYFPASFYPSITRPRWGDYGAAIFVPSTGGRSGGNGNNYGNGNGMIVFASEYIQSPNCSTQAFLSGMTPSGTTCGGTRAVFANWGSSISTINT